MLIASAGCAVVALYIALVLGRSVRSGFSGKLGTYAALLPVPAAVAALWALALVVGWWTVAAFGLVSLVAGITVVRNEAHGVTAQPSLGLLLLGFTGLAWVLRYP